MSEAPGFWASKGARVATGPAPGEPCSELPRLRKDRARWLEVAPGLWAPAGVVRAWAREAQRLGAETSIGPAPGAPPGGSVGAKRVAATLELRWSRGHVRIYLRDSAAIGAKSP